MEHNCEIERGSMHDVYVCQIIMSHTLNILKFYLSYKAEKEKKKTKKVARDSRERQILECHSFLVEIHLL